MQPEKRDLAYLWDMREAARDVLEFTKEITDEHFCRDKLTRYAVERRIELIGKQHVMFPNPCRWNTQRFHGRKPLASGIFLHMNMREYMSKGFGGRQRKVFPNYANC